MNQDIPKASSEPPMPAAVWWIVGAFAAVILIWCLNAGIERTLSWLAWTIGPAIASAPIVAIGYGIGSLPDKEGGAIDRLLSTSIGEKLGILVFVTGATAAMLLALLSAFMLAVGVFGAAKTVLNPFIGHHHEDLDAVPDNWRR